MKCLRRCDPAWSRPTICSGREGDALWTAHRTVAAALVGPGVVEHGVATVVGTEDGLVVLFGVVAFENRESAECLLVSTENFISAWTESATE